MTRLAPSILPRIARALGVATALLSCALAFAQDSFPTRTITWIVGFPPGGTVDVATRLVARRLESALGQPVVIDNRPGASGAIGLHAAAKAGADGYTLVTVPGPVLTVQPLPQVGRELTGVAMLGKGPMVLVGPVATAVPSFKDLLDAMRRKPDAYSFASSGNGTSQHLAGELINEMAHVRMQHVPYKGGGQAVTDVIGGQVPLAILGATPVLPHIKAGRLKAYGVTTATRSPALPDVPTLAEAGLSGFDASQWFVVAAPAGVPAQRLARLNTAINAALHQPDVASGLVQIGLDPVLASPAETTAFVSSDLKRWQELARREHLTLE